MTSEKAVAVIAVEGQSKAQKFDNLAQIASQRAARVSSKPWARNPSTLSSMSLPVPGRIVELDVVGSISGV